MDAYCALGASTASMDWQRKVGLALARDYRCYALGGTRWIHTEDSVADLTADASGGGDNRVMANQLLRLLEDKEKSGYSPDMITVLCGLNRRYSVPVIDMFWESGVSDMGGLNEPFVQPDRIHPNARGEYLLYIYLEKRLRQMYLPKKDLP